MFDQPDHRDILALFADILDYPAPGLADKAARCAALAATAAPEAEPLLDAFHRFAEATPIGRLEEIYSGFFDLNPVCHPYVGYQLFGENYKRSRFLLGLKSRYRSAAFHAGAGDLADRLSTVLRFVALGTGGIDVDDLLREGLVPALERMTTTPESSDHDHDHAPEFDGDTGVERRQLDGHSHGEVLAGGFVLASDTEAGGAGAGEATPHPYHQALQALRLVLGATCPP